MYLQSGQSNKQKNVCKEISVCKEMFYHHQNFILHNNQQEGSSGKYTHTKCVRKGSLKAKIQRQCVLDFLHRDK